MTRRGSVAGYDARGMLDVRYADGGVGDHPVLRPHVGSSTTGLHSMPPLGASVLTLYEDGRRPQAHVTAEDTQGVAAPLTYGETAIYGARGETLVHATASGPTILYTNATNTLAITVDPATGRINLTCAGGLYVNGVAVSVP